MMIVGVLGMQHEVHALEIQRRKILIRIAHGRAENVPVKRERTLYVAHQQI